MLRKRFPLGSSGEAMRAGLLAEGFTNAKPPPPDCYPERARAPVGARVCPEQDWQHRLDYDWGNLPCPQDLTVTWQTDRAGRIIKLDGGYGASCL